MPRIAARAYAKLNLALALGPAEPPGSARPGWHPICTWMHAIDLADDLLVEPLGDGSASTWSVAWAPDAPRPGAIDWMPQRDLAWRALAALEDRVGRKLPSRIVLRKRIPTGAGLGGGSSDAAAALIALDRAWNLGLGAVGLRTVAATLGSDVAFFVDEGGDGPARPAVVGGFGERIERVPRAPGGFLLVVPHFGCPTPTVYAAFDRVGAPGLPGRADEVRALARRATPAAGGLFNDLSGPACSIRPALADLRARAAGALDRDVHITGSGSGLFALCDPTEGASLAQRVRAVLPPLAVIPGRFV